MDIGGQVSLTVRMNRLRLLFHSTSLGLVGIFAALTLTSCETADDVTAILDQIIPVENGRRGGALGALTTEEIVLGLKEALKVGTKNASSQASRSQGFYSNPQLRIPFPQSAIGVKNFAMNAGLNQQVTNFEIKLNAAAEQASGKAKPIFYDAVAQMSINDAMGILKGNKSAATNYFRAKTAARLKAEFRPVVENAFASVKVAKHWTPLTTAYNVIGKKQVNTDLVGYVTDEAVDGLFLLIANEERKIREDPVARVSEILRRVFGSA